ncbi:MAG TPA: dihydrofolate reductase family protein [Ktedonobacterales bacterium]
MRKVILMMRASLDGYVCTPDNGLGWMFSRTSPDVVDASLEFLRTVDTNLMGRVNYQEQAYYWPKETGEIADLVNNLTHIVFSKTLDHLEWQNSRLATGTPAEEVARLKQHPGKHIFVPGGASFAQEMTRADLIDEYRIVVIPVALGAGKPIFKDLAAPLDLKLTNTHAFTSGVVELTYERPDRA